MEDSFDRQVYDLICIVVTTPREVVQLAVGAIQNALGAHGLAEPQKTELLVVLFRFDFSSLYGFQG